MSDNGKARPWVSAIQASTLDGKLRSAGGIDYTSHADRRRLLEGRARADVVLVGGEIVRDEISYWVYALSEPRS